MLVGIYFGSVLTKSEVVRWQRVHDMFLFREPFMYLIISTGIVVAAVLMLVIKKLGLKSIQGAAIKYEPKPFHTGVVIGGMIFGAGWAITGACPGPIYAQIGGGFYMSDVKGPVTDRLQLAGFDDAFLNEHIFMSADEAMRYLLSTEAPPPDKRSETGSVASSNAHEV